MTIIGHRCLSGRRLSNDLKARQLCLAVTGYDRSRFPEADRLCDQTLCLRGRASLRYPE